MYIVSYRSQGLWRAAILHDSFLVDAATLNPTSYPSTVRILLEAGASIINQLLEQAQDAFSN
jgi:hypothetical protein